MNKKTILKIQNMNISFKQNDGEKVIVKNGRFEVNEGELVLILGENGSGKSSIFRSLIRENNSTFFSNLFSKKNNQNVDTRDLYFDDELIDTNAKLDRFRRSIGYARQEDDVDSFFSRKVLDYLYDYVSLSQFYIENSDEKIYIDDEIQKIYHSLKCEKYADGNLKNRKLKICSGGEKRMVSILAALSRTKSKLFILDEPINNLDAYHARILNNYLVELRKRDNPPGILIITHCPMFQNVDRVYKLHRGQLTEVFDYEAKSCYGNCNSCGLYEEEE